jgi:hypothetical protein
MGQSAYFGIYPDVPFGDDLRLSLEVGIAYQTDGRPYIAYDQAYYDNYVSLRGTDIARRLNESRVRFAGKYAEPVFDLGVGSGEFIASADAAGLRAFGYDINPVAVEWLKKDNRYRDPYQGQAADLPTWTLWDTLEHIPDPYALLDKVPKDTTLILSLPIFADLLKVRSSKHYKPGEHLVYFSTDGLIRFMADAGFELDAVDDGERLAGREDIAAFAFKCVR